MSVAFSSIVVLGVGVKKSDNDRVLYKRCTSRPININLENFDEELTKANETFEQIQNYCLENHRKGTR